MNRFQHLFDEQKALFRTIGGVRWGSCHGDTGQSAKQDRCRHAGRGNAVPCRNVALVPADRTEPSCKDVCPRPRRRRRGREAVGYELAALFCSRESALNFPCRRRNFRS